jgi:hypothetical protein
MYDISRDSAAARIEARAGDRFEEVRFPRAEDDRAVVADDTDAGAHSESHAPDDTRRSASGRLPGRDGAPADPST